MTDAALVFDADKLQGDLALTGALLDTDEGLETAVVISLFTDRRARRDDRLPEGAADRRGWWGDALPPRVGGVAAEGDRIGSRLWLIHREKNVSETINQAREYAEEGLQWLLDDGIAERVEVTAEATRPDLLGLLIAIRRPAGDVAEFRFHQVWEATA